MAVGNPGQWEVVGGKVSKIKPKQTDKKPAGKNGAAEKKPPVLKLDELVPIETRFGILDPELKELAKQQKEKEKEKPKNSDVTKKKAVKEISKEKEVKVPKTLDNAIKELRIEQLKSVVDNVTAKFKDSPSVWLKDLVAALNIKLGVDADPIYSNKPKDYPSSILPAEVRKLILNLLSSCPDAALQAFYQQFFLSIATDMNKGLHVEGTKIVLQLLSSQKPDIVIPHLARHAEHLRSIQSRVPACLASLWVLAQAAYKNPKIGLQVFMEAMLPLLSLKNFAPFVSSATTHLAPKVTAAVAREVLTPTNYIKLFDLYYGVGGSSLSPPIRREIEPFFTAVTKAATQNLGPQLFVPLFTRLKTETGLEKELCRRLLELLENDPASADSWVSQYKNNLQTSAVLLKYLAEHNPELVEESPELRSALLQMKEINEDLSPSSKIAEALNSCVLHTELLLQQTQKKRSSGGWLKFINYLLFFALAAVVYYDVTHNGNGTFAQSRLGLAAEKYGLTEKYREVYAKAEPYIETARVKMGPIIENTKVYAGVCYAYIYNKAEELRPGIWKELGEKYEIYSAVVKENALLAAEVAKKYGIQTWEKTEPYYKEATQYIKKYINEENAGLVWQTVNQAYHKALHALGLCSH